MDETQRPVKIPPEFSIYAEKHHIFEVFQQILTALIIKKPNDPLTFISDYLKRITDDIITPRVLILGPPLSGKTTIAQRLKEKFNCEIISEDDIFPLEVLDRFGISSPNLVPISDWVDLVQEKLEALEEEKKGWIMDGTIPSRHHALLLCARGHFPNHTVILKAPNKILLSRVVETRVTSIKEVNKPVTKLTATSDTTISVWEEESATGPPEKVKVTLEERINNYCQNNQSLFSVFSHIVKEVNADQPIEDVFDRVLEVVLQPQRTSMLQTPRVIFFGPIGSGKETLAKMFHEKYKTNTISYDNVKKHEMGKDSKLAEVLNLCSETCTPEPGELMFDLIRNELDSMEFPSRGWILHGYPTNKTQAEYLHAANYEANRVFFLEVSNQKIIERLTLEGLDPLTGRQYHVIKNPPEDRKIKDRLEVHPHNTIENVCYNITQYRENEASLKEFYSEVSFCVNAEMDLEKVFEMVESIIVNPIPQKINKLFLNEDQIK